MLLFIYHNYDLQSLSILIYLFIYLRSQPCWVCLYANLQLTNILEIFFVPHFPLGDTIFKMRISLRALKVILEAIAVFFPICSDVDIFLSPSFPLLLWRLSLELVVTVFISSILEGLRWMKFTHLWVEGKKKGTAQHYLWCCEFLIET